MQKEKFSYTPRKISFIEILVSGKWRLKVYGITSLDEMLDPQIYESAKTVAVKRIAEVSADTKHYNTGFLIINQGKTGNFVCVDFWTNENELHNHVYTSSLDNPAVLEYVTPMGISACVWDLRVMCFEREAWLGTVLNNDSDPDFEAYLGMRLNEKI